MQNFIFIEVILGKVGRRRGIKWSQTEIRLKSRHLGKSLSLPVLNESFEIEKVMTYPKILLPHALPAPIEALKAWPT